MRTDDGSEVITPGIYDLGNGRRLTVWLTGTGAPDGITMWACSVYDHGPFCRMDQEVDGVLNALLVNVLDGKMECSQGDDGEFRFRLTQAGTDATIAMIKRLGE